MKITDEVVASFIDADELQDCVPWTYAISAFSPSDLAEAVIQAYLKSIWKVFDALNSETWPDDKFSKDFLLKFKGEGDVVYYKVGRWNHKKRWFQVDFRKACPHAYLDPADIMVTDVRQSAEIAIKKVIC